MPKFYNKRFTGTLLLIHKVNWFGPGKSTCMLQKACALESMCFRRYVLQNACALESMCFRKHVLQKTCVLESKCFRKHVLQKTRALERSCFRKNVLQKSCALESIWLKKHEPITKCVKVKARALLKSPGYSGLRKNFVINLHPLEKITNYTST